MWWVVGPGVTDASIKWYEIEADIGKKTLFTSNRQSIWLTSISPRFFFKFSGVQVSSLFWSLDIELTKRMISYTRFLLIESRELSSSNRKIKSQRSNRISIVSFFFFILNNNNTLEERKEDMTMKRTVYREKYLQRLALLWNGK